MTTIKHRKLWILAVLTALLPAGLAASTTPEELERRAAELANQPGKTRDAADLYVRAAELREDGDPQVLRNLRVAGRLYAYAGRQDRSIRTFAEAGETALRFGDVISAAESFLDAAWVAGRIGDAERMNEYAARGRDLARSPLLAEADRARLLGRIGHGAAD